MQCRKLDYKVHIIGLDFCLVGGAITYHLTAFLAFVDKHEAVLGIGLGTYGAKYATTGVGSVTGIYIHMKRAEAERAMVS